MGARGIARFAGKIECQSGDGAVNLVLSGRGAGAPDSVAGAALQVLFNAATPAGSALQLEDARVEMLDGNGSERPHEFRIESPRELIDLQARGVQVHRVAGGAFFRAVPPPPVAWSVRLGWFVLLAVLRIPGAAGLLQRLRGGG